MQAAMASEAESALVAVEPSGQNSTRLAAAIVRSKDDLHGALLFEFGSLESKAKLDEAVGKTSGEDEVDPATLGWALGPVTADAIMLNPIALVARILAIALAEGLSELHYKSRMLSLEKGLHSVHDVLQKAVHRLERRGSCGNLCSRTAVRNYEVAMKDGMSILSQDLFKGGIHADAAALWEYDETSQDLVRAQQWGVCPMRINVENTVVGDAVKNDNGKVTCSRNVQRDHRVQTRRDSATSEHAQGLLCIPLPHTYDGGGGTSVVQLQRFSVMDQSFTTFDHYDLLEAEDLQSSALPTMVQIREELVSLFETEREREALQAIVASLSHAESVIEIAAHIEKEVPKVMVCERCTFFFVDNSASEVWAPAISSRPKFICCKFGEGLVGHVAQEATANKFPKVLTVNDPESCSMWLGDVAEGFVTHNIMTAPVFSMGKNRQVTGVIQILNKRTHQNRKKSVSVPSWEADIGGAFGTVFGQIDARLLEQLCEGVAIHLDRLLVDIMCAKACMVESKTDIITTTLMSEYYESVGAAPNIDTVAHEVFKQAPGKARREELSSLFKLDATPTWANITNWELDYWRLDSGQEFQLFLQAFNALDVPESIEVVQMNLHNFYTAIKKNHRPHPYHNFQHALAVIHYSTNLSIASTALKYLNGTLRFAMLISGLCHDVDHRGCNNAFEIMSRSELALRYNDYSPLESHAAARTFEIAFSKGTLTSSCNVFKTFDTQVFNTVRQIIVAAILSTDMKNHGKHMKKLQALQMDVLTDDMAANAEDRIVLVETFLHAADIANPFMPKAISAKWGDLVTAEFISQVEQERKLGLPVTAFMDGLQDPVAAAKGQVGFAFFVVQPLVEILVTTFPTLDELRLMCAENLRANKEIAESGKTVPA
eukprot:TRINITY_DN6795_c0_g2_i2.p1 TRINITY_DN6795_c0_g2~~TRINITY_DN6795_c0_g2_i2.p1  ORF type:complete len:1042 (+),score=207.31 TRINITY_DN6795_c0_g2_i2:471-3128(+)